MKKALTPEEIEEIEDRIDLEAAREALKEPGSIPWEKIKAAMGLDGPKLDGPQPDGPRKD